MATSSDWVSGEIISPRGEAKQATVPSVGLSALHSHRRVERPFDHSSAPRSAVVAWRHPSRLAVHIQEEGDVASSGKRKTTRAKLDRERKLVERRMVKKAKKQARREAAADPAEPSPTDAVGADLE